MENRLEKIMGVVGSFKGHNEVSEPINLAYQERVCQPDNQYTKNTATYEDCDCICDDCLCTGDFCDDC
jgi:hypothetical protein